MKKPSNTITLEIEFKDFLMEVEVDRAGEIYEAWMTIDHCADRIDCLEAIRNSPHWRKRIENEVTAYDWIARKLEIQHQHWEIA